MKARSHSADAISTCALLLAGGVGGGVLVFMVALPLALSSPFPKPREGEWILDDPPFRTGLAAAPVETAQADQQTDAPLVMAALGEASDPPLTFTERWNLRVPQAAITVPAPDDETVIEVPETTPQEPPAGPAAASPAATRNAAPESRQRPAPPAKATAAAPPKHAAPPPDPVEQYLWEVYQRKPVKSDSTGDFTWKDQAAAKRLGMSLRTYVIGGMDPDFREQLYHAGHAMDANGLRWSMLSAFRDDYRQGLAAGFKAHVGNSQHGGSRATGGYGHGRAIDITSAEGDSDAILHWLDAHGAKYGLQRPMPRIDPAHIQARSTFHDLAQDLREARLKLESRIAGKGGANARTKLAAQIEESHEGRHRR